MHLQDVQVTASGSTGGNARRAASSVYNPNNFRLDATRLTYNVLVGDSVPLANGTCDSRFTVQANDSTIVRSR